MNFFTVQFVLFFVCVLCAGWLLRSRTHAYRLFLVAASLVFYACAGIRFLPLLVAVAVMNWGTVRLLALPRCNRKAVLAADVVLHILLLAFFKYYEFLVNGLAEFCNIDTGFLFSEKLAAMAYPVGLSFFSFQGISLAVDHYRTPEKQPTCFLDVLAYVSFFPTVMSGPIMREAEFLPQLRRPETCDNAFAEASALILSGLMKKVVLASYLSVQVVDPVYDMPDNYSAGMLWLVLYAYAVQIYCDFSGYTDLAMGIGRLMGFRLPENFNRPYLALNLQDFWRRWHMSLSLWLRDYLYISMGGSRRGNRYVNLFLTMLIGGLWHGCGLKFIVWGAMHGIGLAVVHAFHSLRKNRGWGEPSGKMGWVCKGLALLLTFHVVALLWVFFRAADWGSACHFISGLCSFGKVGESFSALALLVVICGLAVQTGGTYVYSLFSRFQARLPWYVQGLMAGVLGCLIMNMGPEGTLPFIYFSF